MHTGYPKIMKLVSFVYNLKTLKNKGILKLLTLLKDKEFLCIILY